MSFGERLREWREVAGLTQDALADELRVKQQTVSDWENGNARPKVTRAAAIATAVRVQPEDVLRALAADELVMDAEATLPPIGDAPAALSGKWHRLSEEDRRYVEGLVDRLLGEEGR